MNRPRNIAIKLVLFLLLGAIVNVAVAWGCSLWSTARYTEQPLLNCDSPDLNMHNVRLGIKVPLEFGPWLLGSATVVGAEWHQMMSTKYMDSAFDLRHSYHMHLAGWPMRSLHCIGTFAPDQPMTNGQMPVLWQGAASAPRFLAPDSSRPNVILAVERPLPLTPFFTGFAINTIFYAAILWIVFAIPGTLKRHRRRVRGQCSACGYDLRGQPADSKKCPECGRSAL